MYDKRFCIKSWQKLQIYFLYIKRQAKNNFLKDVESTVDYVCNLQLYLN